MIEVKLKESNNKPTDLSDKVTATIEIDEQLDTSLDSGTIRYITTEPDSKGLNEPLAKYSVNVDGKAFDFVGMDSKTSGIRKIKKITVSDVSPITNKQLPPIRWEHTASGKIKVNGADVKIISVSGNIMSTYPDVRYGNGEIVWEVTWRNTIEYHTNYVVTIVYTVIDRVNTHEVALTESSKLLQGIMIDGFGVTRPETISYDNYTNTVSQDVKIQSRAVAQTYEHKAEGAIFVGETIDDITDVVGSIKNVAPNASFDEANGAINWSVQWRDSTESYERPYTVTITYTYTMPNAATLKDVVDRLLAVTPFDGPMFALTDDNAVLKVLDGVVAPEFKWNTQTTLWECLLQVGAVIDAMPVLVGDEYGNYTVVTFEFVNAAVKEATSIDDGATNALGENVNESQYNSALSAVVENLRENE